MIPCCLRRNPLYAIIHIDSLAVHHSPTSLTISVPQTRTLILHLISSLLLKFHNTVFCQHFLSIIVFLDICLTTLLPHKLFLYRKINVFFNSFRTYYLLGNCQAYSRPRCSKMNRISLPVLSTEKVFVKFPIVFNQLYT